MRDYIDKNRVVERRLGIYELKDNEFKYLITGSIPFTLVNKELVLNPQSPANKRATSFDTTKSRVHIYKRVERSMKDSNNIKLGTSEEPTIKPPTGASEPPVTEPPAPSPQLQDLRQQRLKVAQERMNLWKENEAKREERWKQSKPGKAYEPISEELGPLSQQLLEAKLALATDQTAKVKAMEEHLLVLKQIEQSFEKRSKQEVERVSSMPSSMPPGTLSMFRDHSLLAQLRRIEFEIQLQELKEKR